MPMQQSALLAPTYLTCSCEHVSLPVFVFCSEDYCAQTTGCTLLGLDFNTKKNLLRGLE